MSDNNTHDRRKNIRLKGRREAILITPNGVHHIRDISAGGLCFVCDDDDFFPDQLPVEIIYAGTPLYIRGVSVRLVREVLGEAATFISTPTKEIGVAFVEMDARNRRLLDDLIAYHSSAATS